MGNIKDKYLIWHFTHSSYEDRLNDSIFVYKCYRYSNLQLVNQVRSELEVRSFENNRKMENPFN